MQETQEMQVQSLGWEDPLEEEMVTHKYSCLKNPMDRGSLSGCNPWGCKEPDKIEHTHTHTHTHTYTHTMFITETL